MAQSLTLIAHRGYSGRYPENTLIAYQAAYDCGARFVELDLQLTADHIPILHHDPNLKRMADVDIDIFDVSYERLESYSASHTQRFGNEFFDNKFTRFKTFCQWLKKHADVTAFVEIKQESIDHFGLTTVMDSIYKQIQDTDTQSQCVIIAFNHKAIELTHTNTTMRTGWILPAWNDVIHKQLKMTNPDFVCCDADKLPEKNEDIWHGPWQWAVYNVDDVNSVITMEKRGVNFLETNEIGTLMNIKK
jgi:glycerophosphoryl diester phosphodiesterase